MGHGTLRPFVSFSGFSTGANGANGCYVWYYPTTNLLYLDNDTGNGLSAGITPGSASTVSNSQCTLAGTGSSYSTSGGATLVVALTFSYSFYGLKYVWMYAGGETSNSGWVEKGTWTVPSGPPPTVVSLTPSSGSGTTQAFTSEYSDPNGTADLVTVRILFNTRIDAAYGCYVFYYPATNLLYLENDTGNGLSAGITPGSTSTVSNSQCTLAGTSSSYSTSGDNATLVAALTFSGTFFTGAKNVWMYAVGESSNSGFVQKGTWTP
jgi:hypothetical protein